MDNFITPEIMEAFNNELEKIAAPLYGGHYKGTIRQSSQTKRYIKKTRKSTKGAFSSIYESKGPTYVPGQRFSKLRGKAAYAGKTIGRSAGKAGGLALKIGKPIIRGIGGAAILAGLGIIGGAVSSPSPKHYRYGR